MYILAFKYSALSVSQNTFKSLLQGCRSLSISAR